ncbi:MAG: hypothetical protein ACR2I0_14305, partial [Rhodoferax sp.]
GLRTLLLHTVKDMQAEAEALQAVREQLHHAVQRPSQSLPQTGTHLLSGPSGAGKTSMLARLACRAAAQPNAPQVAVVSYRDARLGGWHLEHLVANLPGVEYFRADDATALQKVLSQRPRDGLVLIDTAGTQIAQRVAEVQTVCPDCAVHAVMAADSSTASLNRILQASGIAWTSLMVSKLDESVQPWPLVELLCNHTIALSAASDGSHLSDLRTDLSAGALVEMAVAQLSRVPESVSTQPRLAAQAAALVPGGNAARLVLPPVRLKATSNPRGLRGPFN